jgi:hypothetical protein
MHVSPSSPTCWCWTSACPTATASTWWTGCASTSLARLPLVVYSGRELSPAERRQLTLGPTHFLAKARVQPQQLEALVLTMLRSSRQMEEAPVAGIDG